MLITPEGVENEEFVDFVARQRILQRLDRIVIDECHVVLNEEAEFRPLLQQLGKLRSAATQIVLLTATLPPTAEDILFKRMGWPRDQVLLYRSRTSRHNVAYRVYTVPVEEGHDHPFQWV
jgi:superfamily II DNA helicase RecQ